MILPDVTHYCFRATCSATAMKTLPVCRDATAQESAHRDAIEAALKLFDQALQ